MRLFHRVVNRLPKEIENKFDFFLYKDHVRQKKPLKLINMITKEIYNVLCDVRDVVFTVRYKYLNYQLIFFME